MKGRQVLLWLFCLLFFASSSCFSSPASSGWILQQKHIANGNMILYISPGHLRVDYVGPGYSIIEDLKNRSCHVFSDRKKLRFTAPIDKLNYQHLKMVAFMISGNPPGLTWQKVKDEPVGNFKATLYKTHYFDTMFAGSKTGGGYLAGAKRQREVRLYLYICRDISMPEEFLHLISELQEMPNLGGLPIKQYAEFSDTVAQRSDLETLDCKQIAIDPQKWEVPQSYREVKKPHDVISTGNLGVEELLGN